MCLPTMLSGRAAGTNETACDSGKSLCGRDCFSRDIWSLAVLPTVNIVAPARHAFVSSLHGVL